MLCWQVRRRSTIPVPEFCTPLSSFTHFLHIQRDLTWSKLEYKKLGGSPERLSPLIDNLFLLYVGLRSWSWKTLASQPDKSYNSGRAFDQLYLNVSILVILTAFSSPAYLKSSSQWKSGAFQWMTLPARSMGGQSWRARSQNGGWQTAPFQCGPLSFSASCLTKCRADICGWYQATCPLVETWGCHEVHCGAPCGSECCLWISLLDSNRQFEQ